MKTLILTFLLSVTLVTANPGGSAHGGTIVSGPSGVVTSHGPIGPAALGLGGLGYGGHGSGDYVAGSAGPSAYVAGPTGPSAYVVGPAGPSAYVAGPTGPSAYVAGPTGPSAYVGGHTGTSAYVAGPAVSHSSVVGPAAGLGLGLEGFAGHGVFGGLGGLGGFGGFGGYGHSSGLGLAPGVSVTNGGGTIDLGHHGVTVKGPATVPATIAGPAGKVVADGLYGVPTHGHGW